MTQIISVKSKADLDKTANSLPLIARKALGYALKLEVGQITFKMPNGQAFAFGEEDSGMHASLEIKNYNTAMRIVKQGDIGFAEGYLAGEWETPDLTALLQVFAANAHIIKTIMDDKPIAKLIQRFFHWRNRNTRSGSKRNIYAHYDLGNEFYQTWLDDTMTYSSALFTNAEQSLKDGQTQKYRELAQSIGATENSHVLEIGCGWGGFAEYAAKEIGCKLTGLTISKAQLEFAQKRIFEAGLNEKVDLRFQDYRDIDGKYDGIASIEMIEAVGEKYWPAYFTTLRDRMVEGGRAGIQMITIDEQHFDAYRSGPDFIQRYVFPGGMLPTPSAMKSLGNKFGLDCVNDLQFGKDYAKTLKIWQARFLENWPKLEPMGFDQRFKRLWKFYLSYCEAGFLQGNIDVRQMVFAKPS